MINLSAPNIFLVEFKLNSNNFYLLDRVLIQRDVYLKMVRFLREVPITKNLQYRSQKQ